MIALFDFDGVIMDTETQYTQFWDRKGKELLGLDSFGHTIKGQTLKQIFAKFFQDYSEDALRQLENEIDEFEQKMSFEFISGAEEFIQNLKRNGIPCAIVTSSNRKKMEQVYRVHPKLPEMVDAILTSEHFTRSKPDPECFIKGMGILGGTPEETIVFEELKQEERQGHTLSDLQQPTGGK